ncbi:MAG: alpha/beta hydrolase [Deltaproteobacteria bacterium]|nr:alpha/beta hydrolase [Deltaproteobacteria bacterium]
MCKAISNQGYNCFRFDFSGCGESEGEFGSSHYTEQSDDLASVINHFDVDSYKIKGVINHSMGESVAILQAARDPRIGFVVAISPRIFPLNHSIIRKSGKTIDELINSAPIEHIMETNGVNVRRTQTGLNILKSFYSHAFFIQSSRINGFRFSFNSEPLNL